MHKSSSQLVALLIDNADSTTGLKIAHYLVNTGWQNTAATSLANSSGAAVIHHNAALDFRAEGQPTLAELQAVFTAYKKRTDFLTLQNTGNSVLFGATGNNQLDTAISGGLSCLNFRSHAAGATGRAHAAGASLHLRRNLLYRMHQRCVGMSSRISRIQAVNIGKNNH